MKRFNKRTISLTLVLFVFLIAMFIPTIVRAEETVGRVETVVISNDRLDKESTIYVGEIFVDGQSQMYWIYSNDVTKSTNMYNNLSEYLPNPYASLIPSSVAEEGTRN